VLNLSNADWRRMSDASWRTATGFGWDDASDLFERALLRTIQRARREELVALP
jgi:hypothetical protein